MKQNNIDNRLRTVIKQNLPQQRKDEWFVRKTMNRLPHKPAPVFSTTERLAYTFSGLLLAVLWTVSAVEIITNPVLTISALMQPALLTIMSLSLIISIAIPYLKRT